VGRVKQELCAPILALPLVERQVNRSKARGYDREHHQVVRQLFWNAQAVNRSSNLILGSQMFCFEISLPVVQRKEIRNNR
jgi:hypothetical protein